eukprot:maker-scaffold1193_size56161-snap-gene-0.15 protein:Tk04085 transcript:maker-scaffold1193_size56161-snap-gene-0.15-mRNA-1 annotation:"hypothetical protein LOTGIDRAFT_213318"
MATGCVLFHRFYYAKSLIRLPFDVTAMACLGLACKIEECPRRTRDIMSVFHHIRQVRSGKPIHPVVLDQRYTSLKNQIIRAERRVLKELGFCVHVKHPHKICLVGVNREDILIGKRDGRLRAVTLSTTRSFKAVVDAKEVWFENTIVAATECPRGWARVLPGAGWASSALESVERASAGVCGRLRAVGFTWGSRSSLPANWMRSQPKDRTWNSMGSLSPSEFEGVGLSLARGSTLLEMSSTMAPNWAEPGRLVVMLLRDHGPLHARFANRHSESTFNVQR